MNNSDIEIYVLRNLYEAWISSDTEGETNINQMREQGGWESNAFSKIVDRMTYEELIRPRTLGGYYQITASGIISAEKSGIPPEDIVEKNSHTRTMLLNALYDVYEDRGSDSTEHYENLSQKTGQDTDLIMNNLQVLENLGYVSWEGSGFCSITYHGIDAVAVWKDKNALVEEYEHISEIRPQERGRAFQKLFAKIIEQNGWSQDEGVRTSNEEMDVLAFKHREYYLSECKWEKTPIGASVVRELYGKLSNRIDVRGIIVSMSGFTAGAVKQVQDYVGQRVILLFGPKDIGSLLYGQHTLDELLDEKYKELVMRRKVIYE